MSVVPDADHRCGVAVGEQRGVVGPVAHCRYIAEDTDPAPAAATTHCCRRLRVEVDQQVGLSGRLAAQDEVTQLHQALRNPVHRGGGHDEHAERTEQPEQWNRQPHGETGFKRSGHHETDGPAGLPDGGRAKARVWAAVGDVEQAEDAEGDRAPADHDAAAGRCTVGMAKRSPRQRREQHRHDHRARADSPAHHRDDRGADRTRQPPPHPARDDERGTQSSEAGTVAAVRRIEVARLRTDRPGGRADEVGEDHPAAAQEAPDSSEQPAGQRSNTAAAAVAARAGPTPRRGRPSGGRSSASAWARSRSRVRAVGGTGRHARQAIGNTPPASVVTALRPPCRARIGAPQTSSTTGRIIGRRR